MNRYADSVSLGMLLALSILITACASPQTPGMAGQIKPWSYFGTSLDPFWWHEKVQVDLLHKDAKNLGDKRTVAILDTGFLKGHEDVDPANVDPSGVELCSGNQGNEFDDFSGHGTALAGITLGKDKGVSTGGLAPKAKLLTIKVVCGVSNADRVLKGVQIAIDKGVDVILLALGPWPSDVDSSNQNVHQLLLKKLREQPNAQKVLFIVASVWDGKTTYTFPDGTPYKFPPWTQEPNVLLVAGMTLDGADEIEFSDKSGQIWAPARDVETASIEDERDTTGRPTGKHAQFLLQGTSAAAAIVAGCAAAVKLDNESAASLKGRLVNTALTTQPLGKPRLNCLRAVAP